MTFYPAGRRATFAGLLLFGVLAAAPALAEGEPAASTTLAASTPQPPRPLSATAEQIFSQAQPGLLQIRTLLKSAQKPSSIGSGFLVSQDGLAITNYHVVSQYALESDLYQLDYVAADDSRGRLRLLAIDIVNDLAVVQLDAVPGKRFEVFAFNPAAVEGRLVKGERLFSMGNPFDLGLSIVEGTYNGIVEKSYQAKVHFTGALNPGMSGGPAVTMDNRVAGVNVARLVSGDLVSFLVPAGAALRLLEKARAGNELDTSAVRREIGAQMDSWQQDFLAALKAQGFHEAALGPYRVAESNANWFNCWADTNRNGRSNPRVQINESNCDTRTRLFLAHDLSAGEVEISHVYLKSIDLNAMQFARRLTRYADPQVSGGGRKNKNFTPYRCYENFLAADEERLRRPGLRVVWCARAYRKFPGLYDVSVVSATQDRSREALVSSLSLTGVHYANALAFVKDFFATLKVQRDLD
jgi:S1-C subfamily serine protease